MTLQESIQIRVYRRDSKHGVYMLDSTIGDSAVISASIKRQCSADSSVEIGGAYAATLNLQARITGTDAFNIRGAKLEVLSKYSTETEYKSRGTFLGNRCNPCWLHLHHKRTRRSGLDGYVQL